MAKRFFDIAIVVPLEEEAEVVFGVFKPTKADPHDDIMFTEVDLGVPDFKGIVVQCSEMGANEARRACETLFRHFDVGTVVCIGIAGRISNDLLLGDVCYTGVVLDLSEGQKVVDIAGTGGIELLLSPESFRTNPALQASISFSRSDQVLRKSIFENWQEGCGTRLEAAAARNKFDKSLRDMFREFPSCFHGKIACGPVSASKNYLALLRDHDRKLLAIETESGGIFKACFSHRATPCITFRGISDFADAQKGKLEAITKGAVREIAARNAATLFQCQLSNPYFVKFIRERRRELTGDSTSDLFGPGESGSPVASMLALVVAKTESELRDLSPEFRLRPEGYVLPAPRLSPMKFRGDPRAEDDAVYYEAQDILRENNVALVDIPLNYPDEGLPWVLANGLSTELIAEKQVIPIVLDGTKIRPPVDLDKLIPEIDLASLCENHGVQIVFVIHGFDFKSSSRSNHLIAQIEKYPLTKFLFVTRGQGNLIFSLDTVQKIGAKPFRVRGVPFLAIANFIRRNFKFNPVEAEVIAYRIQSAFERFDLLAHPTYFAGIAQETLIALLQANRRTELIQLAVDGFLTFLVAEDKDVPIGRNTRSRFLSELAVEIEVHKRTFSRSDLEDFTSAFFERFDFEENVGRFIERFENKGILRSNEGRIEFTLPFIKKYLLAVALSKDAALAKRHFSFGDDDFDYETFDLYAELGPSDEIVDEVLRRLGQNLQHIPSVGTSAGVLVSGELKPSLLNKLGTVERLRKAVQNGIKTLAKHAADGRRKQQILDVANTTAKQVSHSKPVTQLAASTGSQKQASKPNLASLILPDWKIGCVLLGAAAEQLVARKKLELISLLIQTSSRLIDSQTRAVGAVKFAELKEKMLASEQVAKLLATIEGEQAQEDVRKLLSNMLDLLELAMLAQPFMSTVSFLSEQARHRILGPSIEKADVAGLQEQIVRDTWLADLDPARGKNGIHATIKSLPPVPFFRLILATHLFTRVYWVHWKPQDRLDLLDAADEAIKSLGLSFRQGPTMRRRFGRKSKKGNNRKK